LALTSVKSSRGSPNPRFNIRPWSYQLVLYRNLTHGCRKIVVCTSSFFKLLQMGPSYSSGVLSIDLSQVLNSFLFSHNSSIVLFCEYSCMKHFAYLLHIPISYSQVSLTQHVLHATLKPPMRFLVFIAVHL
jgi:hypothetical protein